MQADGQGSRIAFIDDDAVFELPLFERAFGEEFDVIAATNAEELAARMAERPGWTPDVFVLDLYFPAGPADPEAVRRLRDEPLVLPPDGGQVRQAYQNSLAARQRLAQVLGASKQGIDGGVHLAEQLHARYPGVPIVFYSRKATAEDALRCLEVPGVVDVIAKPSGRDDAQTEALTLRQAGTIAAAFRRAMAGPAGIRRNVKQAVRLIRRSLHVLGGR